MSGFTTKNKSTKIPQIPNEFLISTEQVWTKSNPSDKYPPSTGIYDLIANFVSLYEAPSLKLAETAFTAEKSPKTDRKAMREYLKIDFSMSLTLENLLFENTDDITDSNIIEMDRGIKR